MQNILKCLSKLMVVLSLIWTVTAVAASSSTAASDNLSSLLSNFHALSANFEQTIYDAKKQPIQKTSGTMALSRPGKFRWEVKQPNSQRLIADERYLWIYDIDLSQATRQAMDANKISSPASLLSGTTPDLSTRFNVVQLAGGANPSFKLTPKNTSDLFKWIELDFIDGKLSHMKLSDNLGSLSTFQFTQVVLNPNLSPSLFQFKPPKGVDVIRN